MSADGLMALAIAMIIIAAVIVEVIEHGGNGPERFA